MLTVPRAPSRASTFGETLPTLRDNGLVYRLVAVGLLLFGAFGMVTARHRVIPDFGRRRLRPL